MGARANIIIEQGRGDPPVYLYTHWGGGQLEDLVEAGRKNAEARIGDPHYYTALFAKSMGDMLSGIGTSIDDNEYDIPIVDSQTGEVTWKPFTP